jgi:glutathione peroxidase-family protein
MDCEELIKLFNKVGGVLTCDYNKNTVIVKNTNLKCNIKPRHYANLHHLHWEYCHSPYDITVLSNDKMTMEESIELRIRLSNTYLKGYEYGFEITYLDNKN